MSGDTQEGEDRAFLRSILDGMGIGQRSAVKHIRAELERLWHIEDEISREDDDDKAG